MSRLSGGVQYDVTLLHDGFPSSSLNSSSICHTLSQCTLLPVCVMMLQLQDHTAAVPYRGPCLPHCSVSWQVDCMHGTIE
jgi:hypothetical protein